MMRTFALLIALGVPLAASGQVERIESASPDQPSRYRITVDPAAEPNPPLKYELIPDFWQRKPGNGATFYLRAELLAAGLSKEVTESYQKNEKAWTEGTLDKAAEAAVKKWLAAHHLIWRELQTAAYRERCDFDYRLRDLRGAEAISFLLPDVQGMRNLARWLRVKAHVEILEGRLPDALETLRVAYQLAHDVATSPTLINGLVGISCAGITNEPLLEFIAAPHSPNLYWALASLPRPLVDLRPGAEAERGLAEQIFPFLKDAETADRTPEQWQRVLQQAIQEGAAVGMGSPTDMTGPKANVAMTAILLKAYPEAKRRLIAAGFDPQRVETMPVGQVVAIQTARVTRFAYQEMLKWMALPYDQTVAGIQASEAKLKQDKILAPDPSFSQGALPIAGLLVPALTAIRNAQARLDRDFAAFQAIEAIRWHAAVNQGRLPATLEAIRIVPVPRNPVTGKAFSYRLENNTAILDLPTLPLQPAKSAVRYEIVIRQAGQRR